MKSQNSGTLKKKEIEKSLPTIFLYVSLKLSFQRYEGSHQKAPIREMSPLLKDSFEWLNAKCTLHAKMHTGPRA